MTFEDQKSSIIEQLKKVSSEKDFINALEDAIHELQIQHEMTKRINASLEDVENNRTISLEEFSRRNKQWITEKFTK